MGGLIAVSNISYLEYWRIDQNIATWGNLFSSPQQEALNWGGRLGAIMGRTIIGEWFGVFGELLPLAILFLAVKALRIKSLKLQRAVPATITVMIVGSIAMGHFTGSDPEVLGSGWGGAHGIFIAQWLNAMIGSIGTTILVSFAMIGILYYALHREIRSTVNSINQAMARHKEKQALKAELARNIQHLKMLEIKEQIARQNEINQQLDHEHQLSRANAAAEMAAAMPPQVLPTEPNNTSTTPTPTPQAAIATTTTSAAVDSIAESEEEEVHTGDMTEGSYTPPPLASASTIDPSRISYNADGQACYLMGYDPSGNPVTYSLDIAALPPMAPQLEITLSERAQTDNTTPDEAPDNAASQQDDDEPYIPSALSSVHASDPNFRVDQPEEEQIDDDTINLSTLYDPTLELSNYRKPPVELMDNHTRRVTVTDQELVDNKNRIVTTLESFGIRIDTIEATIGPTVTLYEIVPAPGVRISKIKNLEDDIALSLSALGIRIIAPIPGKGTVGIEVPNKDKEVVSMYSVIKSPRFHDTDYDLPVALGKTIQNETFVFDLAKMPHLLVAGATGQGKSVGLNAIITSLLYKKHPAELKFILVDPKKVELTLYQRLEKHFLAKLPDAEEAIITDVQKVIFTLNSLCIEMDSRYDLLKAAKVRNIKEYNQKFITRHLNPEKGHRYLPYFVVIVDEFADLIMTAGREIETPIARIAQLARAVGIHLIIATQRPTTNIITGVIKANFPARIAFRVTSMIDSRTILDSPGANQLVGRGDMLISTGNEVTRVQCAFIDTPEVERITDHIGNQRGYPMVYELPEYSPEGEGGDSAIGSDILAKRDPLFEEVAHYVVSNQQGSASTIQRKFSIGFNRAGRIVDQLEAAGIVGRSEGSKARQVLVADPLSLEMILNNR